MPDPNQIVIGVDTHADTHVAGLIDPLGRHLGHATFDTTVAGFNALLAWATSFGTITLAGVEGTGAYGAGLARFLDHAMSHDGVWFCRRDAIAQHWIEHHPHGRG